MNWQKVWAVNKYWVMSKSQQQYDYIRLLAKNNQWTPQKTQELGNIIDSLESVSPTKQTLTTTYQHIWGYFKKKCTDEELHQYLRLLDNLQPNNDNLGPFLAKLTNKYQIDYLQKSRIIIELNKRKG
ncbi:DUF1722 domain-containing protein [Levilactobacillus brevis]|uniref:DUF1722 domain-containing protein n=1 Tax=Levilactobacillus brevis TaxID=1580 RepID=UPI002072D3E9|nr:DUF1722 domain-containing protein [Levilactobacillus brevis]